MCLSATSSAMYLATTLSWSLADIKLGITVVCVSGVGAPIGEPWIKSWTKEGYLTVKRAPSRALRKSSAIYSIGSLSNSAVSALHHSMEGGGAQHALVGIVMGFHFRAASFQVESQTRGGAIQVKGEVMSLTGEEGMLLRMAGNASQVTIRCIM